MKKLLLFTTAALIATPVAATADMALRLQDGALVQDFFSAPGASSFTGPTDFAFGDFTISNITGSTTPSTTAPVLLSTNTLDLQSTDIGSHVLDIFVTGNNLLFPTGINNTFSGFTSVSLSDGWTSSLSTLLDTGNGNFTGSLVDSIVFNGNGISTFSNNQTALADFGTGPYSITAHYQITTNGTGQANSGIQFAAAAVPGPVVGAGLPGLIAAGLFMVGLAKRRRNRSAQA